MFDERIAMLPGQWHFIGSKEELTPKVLAGLQPEKIFFLHWSWKVPENIVRGFTCVNFHMTDVPYGRGGSPLQNLILHGHTQTKLSALRMTGELDTGPVYLKEEMSLQGTAQEILERSSALAAMMIGRIIREEPEPRPQEGPVTVFKRRTPAQSAIPPGLSPVQLYDFIRMLDGEGYPPAFVEAGGCRYAFTDAALADGKVTARCVIVPL